MRRLALAGSIAIVAAGATGACATSSDNTAPETAPAPDAAVGADANPPIDAGPCTALRCRRAECAPGQKTTIRGVVYDPAGRMPIFNAHVYVPDVEKGEGLVLPPLPSSLEVGVKCATCPAPPMPAITQTLTDARGRFVLDDVPIADAVPVVVQLGKWRRLFKLDVQTKCGENPFTAPLRLPKNGLEGDLPHVAVAVSMDDVACALLSLGIDQHEFVKGTPESGHVHLYQGFAYPDDPAPVPGAPLADGVWNDVEQLAKFDIVVLGDEGLAHEETKGGPPGTPGARAAVHDYVARGGRALLTGSQYTWIAHSPYPDFQLVGKLAVYPERPQTEFLFDPTVPKAAALRETLTSLGGPTGFRADTKVMNEAIGYPATPWLTPKSEPQPLFTLNTPMGAPPNAQCGRVTYMTGLLALVGTPESWPAHCVDEDPTPFSRQQFDIANFLFVDLATCIADDATPPSLPKAIK